MRTAAPNTAYTQQGAKPACQQDISAKFSQLLLAQLPRTQFTQQGAKPACQQDISAKFSLLLCVATPNNVHTQQAAEPECQQRINANFSQLLLARRPRTTFTQSKLPNPAWQEHMSRQNFRIFYCHGINTKVSQLLYDCGDTDLSHRHPLCHTDTSSANANTTKATQICHTDTSSANTNVTAAAQICHTDTSSANANTRATQICHTDTSCANVNITAATQLCHIDTSSANANITAATSRPAPSGDTARQRPSRACHTDRYRRPAATPRAATFSGGSATQTDTVRLPHRQTPAAATPRVATPSRASGYCACHTDRHGRPAATPRAATPSRGSGSGCHTDRSRVCLRMCA